MRHQRLFFIIAFLLLSLPSFSTHIRAGEVIARRVDNVSLTFEFTFLGYRDVDGVPFGQGQFNFGDGIIYGDDPRESIPWESIEDLGNGVERWQFTITHAYQAPNNYLVSYAEDFRNDGILNIVGSVSTSFYVETLIVIDPFIGLNSTPIFTVPPIDQGVVGFRFEHNPGAFDSDGDSLVYYFTIPKQNRDLDVSGYRSLINPAFYTNFNTGNQAGNGSPALTLNSENGDLVWDAPGGAEIPPQESREYNVAFVVEEWRLIAGQWFRLGFVTRDMQIIIWNFDNKPPEIEVPKDTCVIAGNTVKAAVTGTDSNGDPVRLEAFGGPFEVNPPKATFTPNPPDFQEPPATLNFSWQTACGHIRQRPYDVQFKATDDPTIVIPGTSGTFNAPGTVNFGSWSITVVGPAPTGLIADIQPGKRIQLNWDSYSCPNADSMQVWRRVGEFNLDPACDPGIPVNAGYQLIETVPINETSFLDSNSGFGLSPGSNYCYRLIATFPDPTGGKSVVSEESCNRLLIDVPIITNVDTRSTDKMNGEILVRWTPPYEIDQILFPPDYTYELLRTVGRGPGGTYESVATNLTDTVFTDTGLNTYDSFYAYRVVLFDGNGVKVDTSVAASSTRLTTQSQVGAIQLKWEATVPWSLNVQDFPYHYIYRDHVNDPDLTAFELVDSVNVTVEGLRYVDNGRFNDVDLNEETEYCYYITTQGSYGNALLPEPLRNSTQIACAQPNDLIPPCTPISITFDESPDFSCGFTTSANNCDFNQYQNRIVWSDDNQSGCDDDIQKYRIYVSNTGAEDSFVLLTETEEISFTHSGLSSLAMCYRVTSVDKSGNESPLSDIFCNDNCPNYTLPNFFTPNGDGRNDLFRPYYSGSLFTAESLENINEYGCPRFVKSVLFKVFDRTGGVLFRFNSSDNENNILIEWDGKTSGGKELLSGIYFYYAEVTFIRLNPEDAVEVINGWVQIIR